MSYTYELQLKLDDFKLPRDVDEQTAFGDKGNFWKKYDILAEKFDNDMMARLNGNLDVLLVFAGLFSGVNTAFIVVALAALSAGPADQTNHLLRLLLTNGTSSALTSEELDPASFVPSSAAVRQNCLFFASLGCSLVAAVGAVLAKQWLRYYQMTGQTGPLRQQTMRRTEKLLGAEVWGLAPVVEALPTLLLLSLGLFSAGLVDYLWTIDRTVALVVSAFTVLGCLAYVLSLIAGTISPACPFQSSFSMSLWKLYRKGQELPNAREMFRRSRTATRLKLVSQAITGSRTLHQTLSTSIERLRPQNWYHNLGQNVRAILKGIPLVAIVVLRTTRGIASVTLAFLKRTRMRVKQIFILIKRGPNVYHDDWIYTQSAIWMAETSPEQDIILTIAQNLPFISNLASMKLIPPSDAFTLLLSQFRLSLLTIRHDRAAGRTANAVTMASAVAHIALADPEGSAEALCLLFEKIDSLEWLAEVCGPGLEESEELMIQLLSMSGAFRWTKSRNPSEKLLLVEAVLRKGLRRSIRKGAAATTYLHHYILCASSDTRNWEDTYRRIDDIGKTLSLDGVNVDTAYVSCASRALSVTLRASPALDGHELGYSPLPTERVEGAWTARMESNLGDCLLDLLEVLPAYYIHVRTSSPPTIIHAPLLLSQSRLLVQRKTLYPSNDLWQQTRLPSPSFHQKMHSALNLNIQELQKVNLKVAQMQQPAFRALLAELAELLRGVLLTPGSQWNEMSLADLKNTAHLIRDLNSNGNNLSEAVLYRYFIHIEPDLYAGNATDRRHLKLLHDRKLGPVLISALQFYLWLCPFISDADVWPIFEGYLAFIANGEVRTTYRPFTNGELRTAYRPYATGDLRTGQSPHVFSMSWIPGITTEGVRTPGAQSPRLPAVFDLLRRTPVERSDRTAPQVEMKLVDACQEWGERKVDDYKAMGSCMLWLAESLRVQEEWTNRVKWKRVTRMFVRAMKKHAEAAEDIHLDTEMWDSVDVKGAGVLFLRAWEANLAISNRSALSTPVSNLEEANLAAIHRHTLTVPNAAESDSPGWTANATLEAFATWLPMFESHGIVSIREKDDDVEYIQATITPDLVLSFVERANVGNPDVVERLGLLSAVEQLRRKPIATSAPDEPAQGVTPAGRRRPPPISTGRIPFRRSHRHDTARSEASAYGGDLESGPVT
ncbi:hypothetical protein FRB93_008903 [Tulasnella sp. JGI-2019a]|nr:hypothetical protein FRB93_008903 [Tulasnella sp. JGI-2019a]